MDENLISSVTQLDPSFTQLPQQQESADANQQVDQNEFIQLLVTQLQNQDPLDPMSNEEFAVQLAQFSQVEELIGINEKLDAQSNSDFSSLASYLGTDVILDSNTVNVEGGTAAEQLSFTLEQGVSQATVELIDGQGSIRGTVNLGELSAGKQTVSLTDINAPAGEYTARLSAIGADGARVDAGVRVSGTVSGYVPGPQPTLLVGEREISTADILEVRARV